MQAKNYTRLFLEIIYVKTQSLAFEKLSWISLNWKGSSVAGGGVLVV